MESMLTDDHGFTGSDSAATLTTSSSAAKRKHHRIQESEDIHRQDDKAPKEPAAAQTGVIGWQRRLRVRRSISYAEDGDEQEGEDDGRKPSDEELESGRCENSSGGDAIRRKNPLANAKPPTTSLQSIEPARKPVRTAKTNNALLYAKRREKNASKTGYSFPVIREWRPAPARSSSDGKGLCEQHEWKTPGGIDSPNIYQILRTLERLEEDSNTPNKKRRRRRRRPVSQTAVPPSPAWGQAPYSTQLATGQTDETARGLQIRPGFSSTRQDVSESKQAADVGQPCVDPDPKAG